jgi:hypothetical protein
MASYEIDGRTIDCPEYKTFEALLTSDRATEEVDSVWHAAGDLADAVDYALRRDPNGKSLPEALDRFVSAQQRMRDEAAAALELIESGAF